MIVYNINTCIYFVFCVLSPRLSCELWKSKWFFKNSPWKNWLCILWNNENMIHFIVSLSQFLFWNNWINELCIEQYLHIFYYGDPVYKSTSLVLNDNVCTLVITTWFYLYIYQEFTHHRLMEIIYQCMRIQRTFSGNFVSFYILRTTGIVVYKPGEYVKM